MKKRILLILGILLVLGIIIFKLSKGSMSMEVDYEDYFDIELNYVLDENILKNDIYNFIDLIDDSLFSMSSFSMSDVLNENYDFLTNFAISLVLNNEEYYKDRIVYGEEYVYEDDFLNRYTTDKYVNIDLIYEITNNVFGKNNYMIVNDHLNEVDGMIPLLLIKENISFMKMDKILSVNKFSNELKVLVKYSDVDYNYVYSFINKDDKLVLVNLDVEA